MEFMQLRDSVRKDGILNSLLVRQADGGYEVVDGNHRYTIAKQSGIEELPCIVRDIPDGQILKVQLQANSSRVETSPMEFAHQLWRIVELEKELTINEVSYEISKNPDWTRRMLRLVNLCPVVREALSSNKLSVSLAVEIAKLPFSEQEEYLSLVGKVSSRELIEMVRQQARKVRKGKQSLRQSMKRSVRENLGPELRPFGQIVLEARTPTAAHSVIEECNAVLPEDVWRACAQYILKIDPSSLRERETKLTE